MMAPSATTSFTFAPKQKQKQSARSKIHNSRDRDSGGRNHANKNIKIGDGGNGDVSGPPSDEEETVVCSFGHSSKVVDAWMKEATKEWKAEDKTADRKATQAAEAFSVLIARPEEESNESARRIGSRAGLGAEVASRKRKQEALAKDESRTRIFGTENKRSHHRNHEVVSEKSEGTGGGGDDSSDSEDEFSRTSNLKAKKAASSQDSFIQMYKDSKRNPQKKKKKKKGNGGD